MAKSEPKRLCPDQLRLEVVKVLLLSLLRLVILQTEIFSFGLIPFSIFYSLPVSFEIFLRRKILSGRTISMYACTHTHTHTHARTHARTHVRTHARTHTHTHIYIYIYVGGGGGTRVRACTNIYIHACTHTRTHSCTHAHGCTHTRVHYTQFTTLTSTDNEQGFTLCSTEQQRKEGNSFSVDLKRS